MNNIYQAKAVVDFGSFKFLKILTQQDWQLHMCGSCHTINLNLVCVHQKTISSYLNPFCPLCWPQCPYVLPHPHLFPSSRYGWNLWPVLFLVLFLVGNIIVCSIINTYEMIKKIHYVYMKISLYELWVSRERKRPKTHKQGPGIFL